MELLIGLRFDGRTLAEVDERGGLGTPSWGPLALLRDLELRLGLASETAPDALRVHRWSRRLASLLHATPFYADAFSVDSIGTAEMLLTWRDELIDSGWDGEAVPAGGARLETFAALEALRAPPLPAGAADRLRTVEVELAHTTDSPYAEIKFADRRAIWPRRWQRIFELLNERGTRIGTADLPANDALAETDLGRLQALVLAGATAARPIEVRGDGSLVLLRAPTTLQAADTTAAIVRAAGEGSVAIVRQAQSLLLDDALEKHGAGRLGVSASSRWRTALQILPLALEMVFDPVDSRRALELLGLAGGPFDSQTRHVLSRALGDSPGIGDARWRTAKDRLGARLASTGKPDAAAHAVRQLALIEDWLEPPRFGARAGAPKHVLLATTRRVRDWLRSGPGDQEPSSTVSAEQCDQLIEVLEGDPRESLDLLAVRHLLDAITAPGSTADLTTEHAGRAHHVDHPGGLLRGCDLVIWWHFVAETTRPPHRARWRRVELDALAARGMAPVDPALILAEEVRQWRLAVVAARKRLLLVLPETDRGVAMSPHPLWDEVVARLRLDEAAIARITVSTVELLARPRLGVAVEELTSLALPPARPVWHVPAGLIGPATRFSPSALQALLECPLRWVLGHAASLNAGSVPTIPEGALLGGILGHRMLEALVESGPASWTRDDVAQMFDRLLPGVAASLLQPGMAFERHQLRRQLTATLTALAALIDRAQLSIAAAEEDLAATWLDAELVGRLDLRLHDRAGNDVILDLKWGHRGHRKLLEQGRAVQLATYAQGRRLQTGSAALPAAGYFSISRGKLLATDARGFGVRTAVEGPTLDRSVVQIEATVPAIQRELADGRVWVTGVGRSRPLLESLGVAESERGGHYASECGDGCSYCRFGTLCGRAWEQTP